MTIKPHPGDGSPTTPTPGREGAPRAFRRGTGRLRVVIAEGDPLVRRVLRDVLEAQEDLTVVTTAADAVEAVELTRYYRPDILLTGLELPRGGGLNALAAVRREMSDVRVVILSAPVSRDVEVAALYGGAAGFLSRDMPVEQLPQALRDVGHGKARVSQRAIDYLVTRLRSRPPVGQGLRPVRSVLTDREWEVVDLLGAGVRTGELAGRLEVSPETVRSHLKNIGRKLDATDVDGLVHAADRAYRRGVGAV